MAGTTVAQLLRKSRILLAVAALSLAAWVAWASLVTGLRGAAVATGAALLALVLFLALFNARKKLPFFPLLRATTWMRWHVCLGWFSLVLFFLHMGFRWPSGWLECALAAVFLATALSGILGHYLSRSLPRRMTRAGESLVYERIPRYRREIREGVRGLILASEEQCRSSTLSEFYSEHLRSYLELRPALLHPFALERRRASHRIANELDARKRYLSADELAVAEELEDWIATKENLDFQFASQRLLKGWLFLHIPLTFSLILIAVVHAALALLYGGSG